MADSLDTGQDPAPLSVIIPIRSADPGLAHSLEQALADLSASGHACEVTITATAPLIASLSAVEGLSSVRFKTQEHGSGWGETILAASAQAQHDLICTIDAPSLYATAEVPRLVQALTENNAAMAVGVRVGIQKPIPTRRRILPFILDMLASDAIGRPLPDVNSGFRVVRRSALADIAGTPAAKPALPAALTLLLMAAGATVLFVPVDGARGKQAALQGRIRETFQLVRLIIAFGLEHATGRTVWLIVRMALMMVMMAAMMLMMMWMLGMLPGL